MKKIFIVLFVFLLILSCKKDEDGVKNTNNIEINNSKVISENQNLLIEGNQIWIRETPTDGKVILKLDNGTKCKVLEKGKKETIKGTSDFWYKIEYNKKQGWVFGAQTSLKKKQNNKKVVLDNKTEINNFINNFISTYFENKSDLKKYFIDDSLFEISNPGAIILVRKVNFSDFFNQYSFLDNINNLNKKIIYDKEPEFDMDSFEWKDEGIFVNKKNKDDVLSSWIILENEQELADYSQEILNEAKEKEKIISHKCTITLLDGIIIYFGKINNDIKIIAIDFSTNDA